MKKINTYCACEDCMMYIANGYSGFGEHLTLTEKVEISRSVSIVQVQDNCLLHASDKELGFSWMSCDICDRRTAGNRFEVVGL